MGGLALGSYLAGRCEPWLKRPLLSYGVLEGLIGLWALAVPQLFEAAVPLYQQIWQHFHLSMVPFSLMRFVLASAILIVPTTCMGATLPLLAKFVTSSIDIAGSRIGSLYGANTVGAVFGAALAGFVLLPKYGMRETTLIAASINLILFAGLVAAAGRLERSRKTDVPPASQANPAALSGYVVFAIVAFGISGGAAMIQEVGWVRALQMVIGSTTYSFTIMLATFLLGIALGALLCVRFIDKVKEPMIIFAALQLVIFWTGLFAINQFNYLPYWNLVANKQFMFNPTVSMLVRICLAASILLPLTITLGAVFPVVMKITTRHLNTVGRSVGTTYSANTVGAIFGSFLAGFVLVPLFGVEKTLLVASTLNLVLALGAISFVPVDIRPAARLAVVVSFIVPALCFFGGLNLWDRMPILTAQLQRRALAIYDLPPTYADWQADLHNSLKMLFYKDGASTTVGVTSGDGVRSIITNGHIDGGDAGDMPTQIMLAGLPLILRPDTRSVAVIGWGTGVTVGTAAEFPVNSIEVIELEPVVLEGAKFFDHVNRFPQNNPLVHLQINDGRNYFLATDRKFDLIISEPSNPWQSGVCQLFTREFFKLCHERLTAGGTYALWLQTAEIPPDIMSGIIGSLHDVFPYCLAAAVSRENLVIMASDRPFVIDLPRMQAAFQNKKVPPEVARVKLNSAEAFLARLAMTPAGIDDLARTAGRNIDDTNHLEYRVARTYENKTFVAENSKVICSHFGEPWTLLGQHRMSQFELAPLMLAVSKECLQSKLPEAAARWAAAAHPQTEQTPSK